ncbi:MAG: hypothetical protein IK081_14695 [Lachnospiraceae bacterium]|nr:hypothetical protein [Lachnospiraceae bacterium]
MTGNELQFENEFQYGNESPFENESPFGNAFEFENEPQLEGELKTENELQPEYIVPFQIAKETALEKLRQQMKESKYLSRDFLEYKVKMIPAYVPFWVMDISYEDHQVWKYKEISSDASYKYAKVGGKIRLDQFNVDGVHNLEDVITCGLCPYDYSQIVPNSQIMPVEDVLREDSITVKCEIGKEEAENTASKMIQAAFNREMKKRIYESNSKLLKTEPSFWIGNSTLVLLPIWFCVIYGNDGDYVAYVNGQTGKVVYTLPNAREKSISYFAKYLGIGLGLLCAFLCLPHWKILFGEGLTPDNVLLAMSVIDLPILALLIYIAKRIWHEGTDASLKYKLHLLKVNSKQNLSFLKKDLGEEFFETALTEVTEDELDSDCEGDD